MLQTIQLNYGRTVSRFFIKRFLYLFFPLLIISCSGKSPYDGVWVVDLERTKLACLQISADNMLEDMSDNPFGALGSAMGSAMVSSMCERIGSMIPTIEIIDNEADIPGKGTCTLDQDLNTCTNENGQTVQMKIEHGYLVLGVPSDTLSEDSDMDGFGLYYNRKD